MKRINKVYNILKYFMPLIISRCQSCGKQVLAIPENPLQKTKHKMLFHREYIDCKYDTFLDRMFNGRTINSIRITKEHYLK